jgi:tRNA(Ile)-lysidine synthetase-like protein
MSRGIAWREDSTNSDISILRNKVRHVILPFLEKELDPKIVEHICRSVGYLRETASGIMRRVESVEDRSSVSNIPEDQAVKNYSLKVCEAVGYELTPIEIGRLPACAWFDAKSTKGRTLEVRRWREGDWMKPCGFPHRKKLQDIFVTAKTPQNVRKSLPIVADADTGEVLWIPGYRVSDTIKVSSKTASSIKFCLMPE